MDTSLQYLRQQIRQAADEGYALTVRGGGSKDFYGEPVRPAAILDTRIHSGIIAYDPDELVITAKAGTPLAEIEAALAERRQILPFEPPHFGAGATLGGAVAVGYYGIAYFGAHPEQAAAMQGNHERVFIALSTLLFNPWIAGVILSAILAAVMSTLSCQLLVCSSAITEDFYKGFLRPNAPQKELVWIGRIMVLAVAVIAILIAADPESKVLQLVEFAWAGFGAAFGPIVILSLFWKRMTANGALAGMIAGAAVVVLWVQVVNPALANAGMATLYEIIPGFIACGLTTVVVSLAGKAPAEEICQRFEKADADYRAAK